MNLVLEMNKGAAQAVKVCLSDFDNSQLVTQKQVAVPDYTNIASSLALQYLSNTGKVNLVHCSGRVASQIIRDIEDGSFSSLPFPVAAKTQTIIAGVGTEILDWNEEKGLYLPNGDWKEKMKGAGFDDEIAKIYKDGVFSEAFVAKVNEKVGADVALVAQDIGKQTELKNSMWGTPQEGVTSDSLKQAIVKAFEDMGVDPEKFSITTSVQTAKIAVDFTPNGGTKVGACEFYMDQHGLKPSEVSVSGDSKNDEHCIDIPEVKVIASATSQSEFIEAVQGAHSENDVFYDEENKAAAGLLQGMVHFGMISSNELKNAYTVAAQTLLEHYPNIKIGQSLEGLKP